METLVTVYANASTGSDLNNGLTEAAPVRRITTALGLLERVGHQAFHTQHYQIVLTGGQFEQNCIPGLPGEEEFPQVLPPYLEQISIEAKLPFIAAIDADMDDPMCVPPVGVTLPLFMVGSDTDIRFKDLRIRASGSGGDSAGDDLRKIVEFGFCVPQGTFGGGPIGGFYGTNCNYQQTTPYMGRALFSGTRLECDRVVGGEWAWGDGLRICLIDSTVEFLHPDDVGTVIGPNSPWAVQLELKSGPGGAVPEVDTTFQRTRTVDGGAVSYGDFGAPNAKVGVFAYNSHFRDYQLPAVHIPDFASSGGAAPLPLLQLWHCDFTTTKTDYAGGVMPPALSLNEAFTSSNIGSIYNCAFAGNSDDIEGVPSVKPFPANLDWNGIATTDIPNGTFVDPGGTKILRDISAVGSNLWFADPPAAAGVARLEAHVKPVGLILNQGWGSIPDQTLVSKNVYSEPRLGGPNTIPDIGADESWLYRVWKVQDPLEPTPGLFYFRATAPDLWSGILAMNLTVTTGTIPPLGFDPYGATPFIPNQTPPQGGGYQWTWYFSSYAPIAEAPAYSLAQLPFTATPSPGVNIGDWARFQALVFDPLTGVNSLTVNESVFILAE